MAIKQKQCLLTYLGYDTGGVDGVWDGMSTAACRVFQSAYDLVFPLIATVQKLFSEVDYLKTKI